MSERKLAKAHARWEAATRSWATDTARVVLRTICDGDPLPVRPYNIGRVLLPGEQLMAQVPAQITPDVWEGTAADRPWLVTTERILGRLGDGRLAEWRLGYWGRRATISRVTLTGTLGIPTATLDAARSALPRNPVATRRASGAGSAARYGGAGNTVSSEISRSILPDRSRWSGCR
jgi:hypothetical protein